MPANVTETESCPTTVQGPAGGDARTAKSVRDMASPLASRTLWLRKRMEEIFGEHSVVEAVDAGADTIGITGHPYSNGDVLRIVGATGATLPGGLFSTLVYYVVSAAADTFKLSLTSGGSAIDISSAGSGTLFIFKVPAALDALKHPSFTTLKGDTIPASHLRATLAIYYMSTLGGTFTGEVTRSGDNATQVDRVGVLPDSSVTITVQTKCFWHCPDVSANQVFVLNDPPKAGLRSRIARPSAANAFTATFNRSDTSTIGVLADGVEGGFLDVESYDDGGGLKWHGCGNASSVT